MSAAWLCTKMKFIEGLYGSNCMLTYGMIVTGGATSMLVSNNWSRLTKKNPQTQLVSLIAAGEYPLNVLTSYELIVYHERTNGTNASSAKFWPTTFGNC